MSPNRPNPDLLLRAVQAEETHRGRLKIFFGGCAGVGKTYAMLVAAREKLNDSFKVVVGVVETHGRVDTRKMLDGMPVLPLRETQHRGITVHEFDIDTALLQKPDLILLDELAHTNAPGSRHPKRWQDVEELLDAGVDVYTTLNVQHLESLNDLVASITSISVKETVPDLIFDQADDIVLVDIPPDELLKRLREGKVYLGEDVRSRAADNFFKKSNLIALRELALRRTAERVDAQMDDTRALEGVRRETASVSDRLMVCVGPDPLSARLVRSTRRLARAMKAQWTAVYVENERHAYLNERGKNAVQSVLRMAERIGGKAVVLQGDDPVEEIMSYAKANRINKVIVGKSEKPRLKDLFYGSLVQKLIRASGDDIDVYVITGKQYLRGEISEKFNPVTINYKQYGVAVIGVVLSTLIGLGLGPLLELKPIDQIMIFLIGCVLIAARYGRGPAILYSVLSANFFNFFFVEPLYTLTMYERSYWTSLGVMLVTSYVIADQASRLRLRALFARKHDRDTQSFYTLTRALAATRGYFNMATVASQHIEEAFDAKVVVWIPEDKGALKTIVGQLPLQDEIKEISAVQWCYDRAEKAGHETMTMPSAKGLYLPLFTDAGTKGVLGILRKNEEQNYSLDEVAVLETFASLLASSFERAGAADAAEKATVETEREKLRNILLSSVSHDLRTPLASIIGSSSSMMADAAKLSKETIAELANGIHKEARRLSRIVTNLLDVTRLESGNVQLNLQPYFVEELIGAALTHVSTLLSKHKVVTHAEENIPMVLADGTLIEQVLVNLLANAARYTPEGTIVSVSVSHKNEAVMVAIADQGAGVPIGEEQKIFDKFYTLGRQSGQKGTGLGLAVCHGIITAHKSEIWVQNNQAGGATFYFTLPMIQHVKGDDEHGKI